MKKSIVTTLLVSLASLAAFAGIEVNQLGNSNTLVRISVDRSSIEAFDGNGRFAMTNLVFPTSPYSRLTIAADGGRAKINSVNIYPINVQK